MLLKKIIEKAERRLARVGKRQIIIILALVLLLSSVSTTYTALSASHIRSMTLTLNYEGAKKGQNPTGSRFNIADIKSDKVLKKVIEILGDDSLSVANVRPRIYIDSKMPKSAIDQTTEAIAAGSTYSYSPSEFDIYYSQKSKLGRNNTVAFLKALSEAYSEYFTEEYSEKNTILRFTEADYSQYDYQEIYQILSDKINSMITYLDAHQQENSTFRSQNTGYNFGNLMTMLINLRDIDLAKFNAYVVQNEISKDRAGFIRKKQYLVDKGLLQYNMLQQSSDIMNDAMNDYEAQITGVAFIPSVDSDNQFYMSRTKTGLDNLVNKSYTEGMKATAFKKNIDEQRALIEKYSKGKDTPGEVSKDADKMVYDICEYISRISVLSVQTDEDYMSVKTHDYITFKLPDASGALPIASFIKNFVLYLAVILILLKLFYVIRPLVRKKKDELRVSLEVADEEEKA